MTCSYLLQTRHATRDSAEFTYVTVTAMSLGFELVFYLSVETIERECVIVSPVVCFWLHNWLSESKLGQRGIVRGEKVKKLYCSSWQIHLFHGHSEHTGDLDVGDILGPMPIFLYLGQKIHKEAKKVRSWCIVCNSAI